MTEVRMVGPSSAEWMETGEKRRPIKGEFRDNGKGYIYTTRADCKDGASPRGVLERKIVVHVHETPEVEKPSPTAKWNGIGWYEV